MVVYLDQLNKTYYDLFLLDIRYAMQKIEIHSPHQIQ